MLVAELPAQRRPPLPVQPWERTLGGGACPAPPPPMLTVRSIDFRSALTSLIGSPPGFLRFHGHVLLI